jgi:hypothetical protein
MVISKGLPANGPDMPYPLRARSMCPPMDTLCSTSIVKDQSSKKHFNRPYEWSLFLYQKHYKVCAHTFVAASAAITALPWATTDVFDRIFSSEAYSSIDLQQRYSSSIKLILEVYI